MKNVPEQDEFLRKSLRKISFIPGSVVKNNESIEIRRRLIEDERVLLTCNYYGEDIQIINEAAKQTKKNPRLHFKTYVNTKLDVFPGMEKCLCTQMESILEKLDFTPKNPVIWLCGDNKFYLYKRKSLQKMKTSLEEMFNQPVNFYIESFIPYERDIEKIISYDPSFKLVFRNNRYSSYISPAMGQVLRQKQTQYSCYHILGRPNISGQKGFEEEPARVGEDLDVWLDYFFQLCNDERFQYAYTTFRSAMEYDELISRISLLAHKNQNLGSVSETPTTNILEEINYYDNYYPIIKPSDKIVKKTKMYLRGCEKRIKTMFNSNIW